MSTMNSTTIQKWIDEKTSIREIDIQGFMDFEVRNDWESNEEREEFLVTMHQQ